MRLSELNLHMGIDSTPQYLRRKRHIAFSASAGTYPYQCGIAAYIAEKFDLTNVTYSGSSGGAWPAILLASERDFDWAMELLITLGPTQINRSLLGAYGQYHKSAKHVFDIIFRGISLRDRIRNKLSISITRVCWHPLPHLKNEIISQFFSNSDIFECMLSSCLIPYAVNGEPFTVYRGWICVDSALTNVTGTVSSLGDGQNSEEMSQSSTSADAPSQVESGNFCKTIAFGGCRMLLSDILSVIQTIATSSTSRRQNYPSLPQRSLSCPALNTESTAAIEESKAFGLFSLGLRTYKSCASHLVNKLASWGSSPAASRIPYEAPPGSPDRSSRADTSFESDDCTACWITNGGIDLEESGCWEEKQSDEKENMGAMRCPAQILPVTPKRTQINVHSYMTPNYPPLKDTPKTDCSSRANTDSCASDSTKGTAVHDTACSYWHDRVKGSSIKSHPDGESLILEITPWMFRPLPLHHYHLSDDANVLWRLYELGKHDAHVHIEELTRFFNS